VSTSRPHRGVRPPSSSSAHPSSPPDLCLRPDNPSTGTENSENATRRWLRRAKKRSSGSGHMILELSTASLLSWARHAGAPPFFPLSCVPSLIHHAVPCTVQSSQRTIFLRDASSRFLAIHLSADGALLVTGCRASRGSAARRSRRGGGTSSWGRSRGRCHCAGGWLGGGFALRRRASSTVSSCRCQWL